jgi:putative hydrolase of the HAD superfamily
VSALKRTRLWFFDLDDTLHHASHAIFPRQYQAMHRFIEREFSLSPEAAVRKRRELFLKHGTTGFGLFKEHGVPLNLFFDEVHDDPELESLLKHRAIDLHALHKLPGRKVLLTNAQAGYTARVLRALKMQRHFDTVLSFANMRFAGHYRPKPDTRMMRMACAALRVHPAACTLVEDTQGHLKAARSLKMHTVLVTGYSRSHPNSDNTSVALSKKTRRKNLARPPYVCAKITYVSALARTP